jgi:hypothetical protein
VSLIPVVSSTNAVVACCVIEWSGEQKDMPVISELERIGKCNPRSAMEESRRCSGRSRRGALSVRVEGFRALRSLIKCFIWSMLWPWMRHAIRHAEGTTCDERERGDDSIVTRFASLSKVPRQVFVRRYR